MSENLTSINSGYRIIQDGKKYEKYFPKPKSEDHVVIKGGEVEQTVDLMQRVVWKYLEDTKRIAPVLKGSSVEATCKNIWEFLYHHIQYKLDQRGLEQLRRPARSWADRTEGIDCDCFSIFIGSILTNLQVPHSFRITKYGGAHFQHVYVVVPFKDGHIMIDPVLSRFDYEKPFSEHKDFPMNLSGIDVAVLSGHAGGSDFPELGRLDEHGDNQEALYNYLVATRDRITQDPSVVEGVDSPRELLSMLNYLLKYWYTDQRDEALDVLIQNETRHNRILGIDEEDDNSLGAASKGFFRRIKSASASKGEGIKKAGNAVMRYNPISIAARLGFLAALKADFRKIASKLKWAYATPQQAQGKGVSPEVHSRSKGALQKIDNLFVGKLKGRPSALKKAILGGRAGGLDGHTSLGEPVTLAASLAAATPVLIAAIKILKDSGLMEPTENTSEAAIAAELSQYSAKTGAAPSPVMVPLVLPRDQGIMAFAKNNPGWVVAGVGLLGVGGYLLLRPKKKKPSRSLSGPRTPRKKSATRSTIQRVTLK